MRLDDTIQYSRPAPDHVRQALTPASLQPAANNPSYLGFAHPPTVAAGDGRFSGSVAGQPPQTDLDLQLAEMSNDSYTLSGPDGLTGTQSQRDLAAAGWTRLQAQGDHLVDGNGHQVAIDPAMLEDPTSGFRASIYQNPEGRYVVAYAGTNPSEAADIGADAGQAFGLNTTQYNQAIALARKAQGTLGTGNVVFTGHSLGGGLASAAALATNASAVTFNAAGLSNQTLRDLGFNPNAVRDQVADSGQIRRYVVDGDPLTLAQQDLPIVPLIGSLPNAVGHELRIAAPAGTIPVIGAHGGSGDHTTYVDALKQHSPYMPAGPYGNDRALASNTIQNLGELNFNVLSSAVQAGAQTYDAASGAIRDTAGDIGNAVTTDYANGKYIAGTSSIAGALVDGSLDVAGDLASGALNFAGDAVQDGTDFAGGVIRDVGDYVGLGKPADAVAGVVEGAGNLVSDGAAATGKALDWATDKLGDGAQWAADKLGDGVQWLGDKTVEGVQWAADKTAQGAQWLGEKTVEGAQWVGDKTVEGAQWVGGKVVDGAVAVKDGAVAVGNAIADGASWVGDKIGEAMPWNW